MNSSERDVSLGSKKPAGDPLPLARARTERALTQEESNAPDLATAIRHHLHIWIPVLRNTFKCTDAELISTVEKQVRLYEKFLDEISKQAASEWLAKRKAELLEQTGKNHSYGGVFGMCERGEALTLARDAV